MNSVTRIDSPVRGTALTITVIDSPAGMASGDIVCVVVEPGTLITRRASFVARSSPSLRMVTESSPPVMLGASESTGPSAGGASTNSVVLLSSFDSGMALSGSIVTVTDDCSVMRGSMAKLSAAEPFGSSETFTTCSAGLAGTSSTRTTMAPEKGLVDVFVSVIRSVAPPSISAAFEGMKSGALGETAGVGEGVAVGAGVAVPAACVGRVGSVAGGATSTAAIVRTRSRSAALTSTALRRTHSPPPRSICSHCSPDVFPMSVTVSPGSSVPAWLYSSPGPVRRLATAINSPVITTTGASVTGGMATTCTGSDVITCPAPVTARTTSSYVPAASKRAVSTPA